MPLPLLPSSKYHSAHLGYDAHTSSDHRGFGLGTTHAPKSSSDKDLPGQVIEPQVLPASVHDSDLREEGEGGGGGNMVSTALEIHVL